MTTEQKNFIESQRVLDADLGYAIKCIMEMQEREERLEEYKRIHSDMIVKEYTKYREGLVQVDVPYKNSLLRVQSIDPHTRREAYKRINKFKQHETL